VSPAPARIARILKTRWVVRVRGTDRSRWSRDSSFDNAWSGRHQLMVRSVRPGDAVIDLGSGPRALEEHLPDGCRYIPVDVVPRGPGSVVCDLNRDPMPDVRGDVVVMSGVLEYIHDVHQLLTGARGLAPRAVVSYATVEAFSDIRDRRSHGWMNDLGLPVLRDAFTTSGWSVSGEQEWQGHRVFELARARSR
jgi:hypothetical protein